MRRNVIVTGGSRGLGLAISRRLVADGFRVIAVARKPSDALDEEIARASGALAFAALDLSQIDAIADFVLRLKKEFGAPYGLVNNAGLGTEGLLATMHNSQIDQLTRVNVTAPIVLTKYVVRNMMSAGQGGRIVNMSSIIASTGYNALSVYGATKAALIGFTKSLSREVGRMGVTVNAVAPGFIETEMTASLGDEDRAKIAARAALRRLAAPEDVANAVSYLLDDKACNITGTVMTVDAGATA
ncbi:SDR family NAD(P)-dependent oxidoreductase [Methylocystis sp. Sn-Cys]|uniref:SDR family NAD(P)-dependent oxidoreductase n=1 Tax=Methylocystis sp. Sn-Cys TaxID=1701263 RepID=UPI0019240A0E|nr:SDR family NAD(P)-dependent oxidoreductase [Methylocystis sp. Sn-Cys]MBL1257064.1 SDR family oxidoreductase [Methylocystis sp. Sn-Cys]